MAEKSLVRRIIAIFDRDSARKAEAELEASLGTAGAKGGENFLRELKRQFETKTADLKVQLAKGIIDEKQFRAQADLAAKEFNTGLIAGMEKARAAGTLTEREYQKLSRQLKKTGQDGETAFERMRGAALRFAATLATAVTLRAIVNFGRAAVKAAADSEVAWRNLSGTVQSAGVDFAGVEPEIREAAEQFERFTTYDDDQFAETLQRLIALTGDYAASLQNVTLVADVAARFFEGDLARAADVVGRAMLGDVEMLKRLGIEAKSAQEALDILAQRSMGAAAERAGTLGGKLEQLNHAWGNFAEAVGNAIIEAGGGTSILDTLTAVVRTLTGVVERNASGIQFLGNSMLWVARVAGATLFGFFSGLATIMRGVVNGYALIAEADARMPWHSASSRAAMDASAARLRKMADEAKAAAESLDQLARAAMGTSTTPAPVQGGTSTPPIVAGGPAVATGAGVGTPGSIAKEHEKEAEAVVTVWGEAMKRIEADAQEQRTVMGELANAWREGGFAGIAALAKMKVKENIAHALENAAKAVGAFFINPAAAAGYAKASAMHMVGAGAWRALGGGGGGSGGGAAGSGGALAAGATPGLQRAESATPPGVEAHIYIDPLSPQDPRYQGVHRETSRLVTERYGSNVNVTWHPRTGT